MNRIALSGAAIAAALACSPAVASSIPANGVKVASAPLARVGNYFTPNDETLYVRAPGRKWYRAELVRPCVGMGQANSLQIAMKDGANLNSSSAVVVNGVRCQVGSVYRVNGPVRAPIFKRFQSRS